MLFCVPSECYNTWVIAGMNGHKSDFRLYSAGKINKMDNKLLYDHLIYNDIEHLQVCIADLIRVENNN